MAKKSRKKSRKKRGSRRGLVQGKRGMRKSHVKDYYLSKAKGGGKKRSKALLLKQAANLHKIIEQRGGFDSYKE